MAIKDSPYDRELIEKADRLYQGKVNQGDVADILGVPYKTLNGWVCKGWVKKEDHYNYEKGPEVDDKTLRKVEEMLQNLSPREIEERTEISNSTITSWIKKGWVVCEKDWDKIKRNKNHHGHKVEPRLVVEYYYGDDDRTISGTAEKYDLNTSTVRKYLNLYKEGKV